MKTPRAMPATVDAWIAEVQGPRVCACGCRRAISVVRHHYRHGIPIFLDGHWSRRPIEDRFWDKVEKQPSGTCWIWMGSKDEKGYGHIGDGKSGLLRTSRLSYEIHCGHIPEGMLVLHSCDTPACVNPIHLRVGTNADNMDDMVSRGRQNKAKGSANSQARLDEEKVAAIRARHAAGGVTQKDLAREYMVGTSTLNRIVSGQSWLHVLAEDKP